MKNEKSNFLNPTFIKLLIYFLVFICTALFLFDFFYSRYFHFEIEKVKGFYAIYGFLAFSIIIFGSKALRFFLRRPENYYGSKAIDGEEKLKEDNHDK